MATQQENWEAVKALFEAALEQEPASRSSFLKERCSDAGLRAEVERLLAAHDDAGDFLSTPALADFPLELNTETHRLVEGEVLAGRFRIVRYIAGGGMGDVYEAEDQELRERVAIKTIRPEVLRDRNAVARFKREVHLARKVTHPNVCRIFDLFRHKGEGTESKETVFISMELLRGRTLAARLKDGRMKMMEAMPLVQQMASALNAAHGVGIVHRDFKPGNIVLVESTGQEDVRAVVTDFGLALQSLLSDETTLTSLTQGLVGTPAYMSPEQLEGKSATSASDIYALGLVIYEMVTGEKAFAGETTLSTVAKRLTETPIPPRKLVPDLSSACESVILRCLMRNPADRFANSQDVAKALEENSLQPISIRTRQFHLTTNTGRLPWAFAVIAILIMLSIVGGYKWWALRHSNEPVVVVAGFRNNSSDHAYDWLATDLSETLTADLSASKDIQTASTDELARIRNEFSIPGAQNLEKENLSQVRQALGANYLLVGGYLIDTESSVKNLALNVRLEDSNEKAIATFYRSGSQADYGKLVTEIAADVLGKLGTARVSEADISPLQHLYPTNAEARRLYFIALDKLRSLDAPAAFDLLKKAVQIEPDDVAIHSALADTWSRLKHDHDAADEAKKAADLAEKTSLPFEYVVLAEARSEEMSQNWEMAIKDYSLLFPHYPQLNYGLRLANAQLQGSHPKDALGTLNQLTTLRPPINSDPRIETERAKVYGAMNDFAGELHSAQLALTEAQKSNARMMQANAELQLCWANRNLGHVDEALAACNQAQTIFSVFGDNVSAAVALNDLATWLTDRGRYTEARQLYERVILIHQAAGAQQDLAGANTNMAVAMVKMGKPQEAQDYINEALRIAASIHDEEDEARARILKGSVLYSIGHLPEAEEEMGKVLALAEQLKDTVIEATALSNLAEYQSETDSVSALAAYEKVLKLREKKGEPTALATCLFNMGDLQYRRGEFNQAEASYRRAIQISTDQKDKGGVALGLASLAQIELERNHLTDAEHQALDALGRLKETQNSDLESTVDSILLRVLVAENKLKEAQGYADRIRKIASQDQDTALENRMSLAIYLAATGNTAEALEQIRALPSDAKQSGRNFASLEGELLLLELQSGLSQETRSIELAVIRKRARLAGFQLLVNRAAHVRA